MYDEITIMDPLWSVWDKYKLDEATQCMVVFHREFSEHDYDALNGCEWCMRMASAELFRSVVLSAVYGWNDWDQQSHKLCRHCYDFGNISRIADVTNAKEWVSVLYFKPQHYDSHKNILYAHLSCSPNSSVVYAILYLLPFILFYLIWFDNCMWRAIDHV